MPLNGIKKKERVKKIKKWRYDEIYQLLTCVIEFGKFEDPTAQLFYRRVIERTNIDGTWDMLRWKMRNLRMTFFKCNEWQQSTEARCLEAAEGYASVKAKVLKWCPHYNLLQQIFGEKKVGEDWPILNAACNEKAEDYIDNNNYNYGIDVKLEDISGAAESMSNESNSSESTEHLNITAQLTTAMENALVENIILEPIACAPRNASAFPEDQRKGTPKLVGDKLYELGKEKLAFCYEKLHMEQQKINNDLEMDEKKLKLDEAKLELEKNKLKFEEEKFKADMEIKKLQIAKEERLAMYEIEMKYKNAN